ncbi:MAG: cytochrome c biogenesis protein CcsA [Pseudomonadota bacterium]
MDFSTANIAFLTYLLAAIIYFIFLLSGNNKSSKLGYYILIIALILNLITIIQRWILVAYPPFSNMYETMLVWACSIAFFQIIFEKKYNLSRIGFFSSLSALLVLAYASFFTTKDISPLVPALQSNWLTVHVISYFISYGALALSFITAIYFVINKNSKIDFSNITYKLISFAFPFLTIGLITGSVWAKEAWGDYWSWDPKEMWSLITWLLYLNFLHLPKTLPNVLRKLKIDLKYNKLVINIFAIIGFLCVVFTYIGVNYLLSGLHSYA